jgi:ABC-type polar amino acid transport system ATPase subunit
VSVLRFDQLAAGRLAPLDLDVGAGEIVILAGDVDDGIGALLTCSLGLAAARHGRALVFDVDVGTADHDVAGRARTRAALGSMLAPLLSNLSVLDNLLVPLAMRSLPEARARVDVQALLVDLGLAGLAVRRPHQLTLRQHRELVLARALLLPVELYLLDDPPLTSRLLGRLPVLADAGAAVVVTSTSERLTSALTTGLTTALSSPPAPSASGTPGRAPSTPPSSRLRVVRLQPAPPEEVA